MSSLRRQARPHSNVPAPARPKAPSVFKAPLLHCSNVSNRPISTLTVRSLASGYTKPVQAALSPHLPKRSTAPIATRNISCPLIAQPLLNTVRCCQGSRAHHTDDWKLEGHTVGASLDKPLAHCELCALRIRVEHRPLISLLNSILGRTVPIQSLQRS